LILRFWIIWVEGDAVYGTHFDALWLIVMAYTFGTKAEINFIDFLTSTDGFIRTLGFTNITVDAIIGNHQ
jgi:hypothetical protein